MRDETTTERLWEVRRTANAILFNTMPPGEKGGRAVWIPRSQISHVSKDPVLKNGWVPCNVTMALWVAQREGL